MAELLNKQILWYKKKMQAFSGRMVVSDTHFSFYRAPKWTLMFGALGALLASSAKGKVLVEDEIKNLKFARGRDLGKKAYMLVVTTSNGESFEFLFDDKLVAKIESAIKLEPVAND
jgi:hypothetical protein